MAITSLTNFARGDDASAGKDAGKQAADKEEKKSQSDDDADDVFSRQKGLSDMEVFKKVTGRHALSAAISARMWSFLS